MAQQQKIAKTNHRRQQVIKVVCDAARQLSHRLHFLRLGKLSFESTLRRRIDKISNQPISAVTIAHRPHIQCRRRVATLTEADFTMSRRFFPNGNMLHQGIQVIAICLGQHLSQGMVNQLRAGKAAHFLKGLITVGNDPFKINQAQPDRGPIKQPAKLLRRTACQRRSIVGSSHHVTAITAQNHRTGANFPAIVIGSLHQQGRKSLALLIAKNQLTAPRSIGFGNITFDQNIFDRRHQ